MTLAEQTFNIPQEGLLQKINSICQAGYTAKNVKKLLEISLREILDVFDAKRGSIFLSTPNGKKLILQAALGMKINEQKSMTKRLGHGIVGQVAVLKKPLLVDDITKDNRFKNFKSRQSYLTPSFICSPLMVKDRLLGVINIADKRDKKKFSNDQLYLLDFLSSQIALNYQRIALNQKMKIYANESRNLKIRLGKSSEETDHLKKQIHLNERLASLGKLAGGIAHEFNNPLDGIIRYTNLCLEHVKDDDIVREYLLEMKQGLKRMTNIVKSLLACARSSNFSGQKVNLQHLLDQVIKELHPNILQKNIRIVKELGKDIPEIYDLGVDRILSNLIRNAIDAVDTEGIISIRVNFLYPNLEIQVEDNGVGIAKEDFEKIFEPFYSTKRIEQGCGLGLTIVSEIVKSYNGKITIESSTSKGTIFTITIPVKG